MPFTAKLTSSLCLRRLSPFLAQTQRVEGSLQFIRSVLVVGVLPKTLERLLCLR
ncbi:MAG TPA: hypothetical protein VFA18_17255 [Gemmataceae bacterium]|nr:hypothetical protein [Gemmataceae bacterium]